MDEYTCAIVSVLILCFFLVLRIFWEEQLAEQFWYFNFSLYLVIFRAEQSKKPPCRFQYLQFKHIHPLPQLNSSFPFQVAFPQQKVVQNYIMLT